MAARVLIVDDSGFFRRRIAEILRADPRLEVAGFAADGAEAVEAARRLRPDVITMDVEMPVMDGIEAVRRIMAEAPTAILMFSSLTHEGARATLDALEAGAADFLPKRLQDLAPDQAEAGRILRERVLALAARRPAGTHAPTVPGRAGTAPAPARPAAPRPVIPPAAPRRGRWRLVVLGSSTGGPMALQRVLRALPAGYPAPVVVIQHMPASFTGPFAERLDGLCALSVREARDGDPILPGEVLLAPGGRQLWFERHGGAARVRLRSPRPDEHYKPSVDVALASAAEACGAETLGVVLTGMGADGREGARRLKARGGTVWAQDEASCVIYGMPRAVVEAGLADRVLPLEEIGPALANGIH